MSAIDKKGCVDSEETISPELQNRINNPKELKDLSSPRPVKSKRAQAIKGKRSTAINAMSSKLNNAKLSDKSLRPNNNVGHEEAPLRQKFC